jgi:hypothetical protein
MTRTSAQPKGRAKLSTTVSLETYRYLEHKVQSGEVSSLAEAVDRSIGTIRRLENREKLSQATRRYFNELEPHAASEEASLAHDLTGAIGGINFDEEL